MDLIAEYQNCGKCERCRVRGQRTSARPHGPYWRLLAYIGNDPPPLEQVREALAGISSSVHYRRRRGGYTTLVVYFGRNVPAKAEEEVTLALAGVVEVS